MKNILFSFSVYLIIATSLYGQCLCADINFQLTVNDLEFKSEKSNYELIVLNAPDWISKTPQPFTKSAFKTDTLKFSLPTKGGIDTLVFEIRNTKLQSAMQVTVLNTTYDNDYLIDLTTYKSGTYAFNWEIIDSCQKSNRKSQFIDCDNLKFEQLVLTDPNSVSKTFAVNHIKPLDLIYFDAATEDYYTKHTSEIIDSTIEKIYHLETNKYLIMQHTVSGSGNHYYDDIKIRVIELNGSHVKDLKTTIEVDTKLGYESEDGGLILSQHQGYSNMEAMTALYHSDTKLLAIKMYWANINSDGFEDDVELHQLYYSYSNSKFEKIAEDITRISDH